MASILNLPIFSPEVEILGVSSKYSLTLKREDLIHPYISGNKFRKLKYNIQEAHSLNFKTLLTFGGAFSNHIAATAAVGQMCGFKTIGIIRGEELKDNFAHNETLKYAQSCGMILKFVTRDEYKLKATESFIENLKQNFEDFYLLPEGGTNSLAVKGCAEIIDESHNNYDYICCSVGTGGTVAGIIEASKPHQQIIGFSALKGTFQSSEIEKYTSRTNYQIIDDYCFGGYAKIDSTLVRFINEFKTKHTIALDPIYTGKMMYGIIDLIEKGFFKENSRILAIHSGGLQGIAGVNSMLKNKNLETLDV